MRTFLSVMMLMAALMVATPAQALWTVGDMDAQSVPRILYGPGGESAVREKLARQPYLSMYNSILGVAARSYTLDDHEIGAEQNKGNIAKAAAFVYAMDRRIVDGAPVAFAGEDDRLAYGRKAELLLANMNTLSRMTSFMNAVLDIHTAQELTLYITAYDILRGAAYPFEDESLVRDNLVALASDFYKDWIADQYPAVNAYTNNHGSKSASALGLAAIVLNGYVPDSEDDLNAYKQPEAWIEWAMPLLFRVIIDALITRDGAFGEGAPYYTYSAINHNIFLLALHRYVGAANLASWNIGGLVYGDLLTHPMNARFHDWLVRIMMPDGSFPPFDDSSPGGRYMFGEMSMLPNGGLYRWAWERQPGYPVFQDSIHQDVDTIVWFDDAVTAQNPQDLGWPENQFLYDGGAAIFRSDWLDGDARYLIMMAEHGKAKCWTRTYDGHDLDGAGGHDHNDPGAIHLAAYGENLLLDAGYLGWTQHSQVYNAHNHNLVLIDGKGPALMHMKLPNLVQDENGEWVVAEGEEGGYIPGKDGDAYLTDTVDLPGLAYARMDTRYFEKAPDSSVSRHTLFVDERAFIVWDEILPDDGANHRYTVLWHGNGGGDSGGTFEALEDGGIWRRDNARVTVRGRAAGGPLSWTVAEDVHDPGDRRPRTHSVIKGEAQGLRGDIVSVIVPEPARGDVATAAWDEDAGLWRIAPPIFVDGDIEQDAEPVRADDNESRMALGVEAEFSVRQTEETLTGCGLTATAKALYCDRDAESGLLTRFAAWELQEVVWDDAPLAMADAPVRLMMVTQRVEPDFPIQVIADVALPEDAPLPVTLRLSVPWSGLDGMQVESACPAEEQDGLLVFTLYADERIVVSPTNAPHTLRSVQVSVSPAAPVVGDTVTLDANALCGEPLSDDASRFELVQAPLFSEVELAAPVSNVTTFIPDLPGTYMIAVSLPDLEHQPATVARVDVALPLPVDGDIDGDDDPETDSDQDGLIDGDLDDDAETEIEEESETPLDGDEEPDLELDEDGATDGDTDLAPVDGDFDEPGENAEGCGCRQTQPDAASALVLVALLLLAAGRRRRAANR
jgi:MYXO-CTERM domain-containing protein